MKTQDMGRDIEQQILSLLAEMCRQRGQAGVAASLGISFQYANDLARGRRGISYELARKISTLK